MGGLPGLPWPAAAGKLPLPPRGPGCPPRYREPQDTQVPRANSGCEKTRQLVIQKRMSQTRPKGRWCQFSLRTVFIAVLLLSLPLSWVATKMERARRQKKAVELIRTSGGLVIYAHEDIPITGGRPHVVEPQELPGPAWLRGLVGEDFLSDVVWVSARGKLTDAQLNHRVGFGNSWSLVKR